MICEGLVIRPECNADEKEINKLYASIFGPGRFARSAYQLRSLTPAFEKKLGYVALHQSKIVATIRYFPIQVAQEQALLLGPLVVVPEQEGKRCGIHLMTLTLERASQLGYSLVLLVGDEPYYKKLGFARVPMGQIKFGVPYNPERLLAKELIEGRLAKTEGLIMPNMKENNDATA